MIDNAVPGVGMDDDERMGVINHPFKGMQGLLAH